MKLHWMITLITLFPLLTQAQSFPYPPCTLYGEVENWNGRAFSTNDEVTVIAKVDGAEMDRTTLISGSFPGINYRLHIPLSATRCSGYAMPGDSLRFEVYLDGALHSVVSQPVTAGRPASVQRVDLRVCTDEDGDGLPDEYEQLLRAYYLQAGQPAGLEDISPDDDFDHDGFSNFAEYMAGTIPVLGSDYLKISAFYPVNTNQMALEFLSAPGRTYMLPQSNNLSSNTWSYAEFVMKSEQQTRWNFLFSEKDQFTTLYLDATNQNAFIQLEVQ